MARACPNCRWFSHNDKQICPHCGELLPNPALMEREVRPSPIQVAWRAIQDLFGLVLLGLLAFIVYRRFNPQIGDGVAWGRNAFQSVVAWFAGPEGQYTDYIVTAVAVTLIFVALLFILWLINRLNT